MRLLLYLGRVTHAMVQSYGILIRIGSLASWAPSTLPCSSTIVSSSCSGSGAVARTVAVIAVVVSEPMDMRRWLPMSVRVMRGWVVGDRALANVSDGFCECGKLLIVIDSF